VNRKNLYAACLAVTVIFVVSGCGSNRPHPVATSGTVTLDGKPLQQGVVEFWPDKGVPARGKIQEDGTFSMKTYDEGDGVVPGSYVVTVKATTVEQGEVSVAAPSSLEEEMKMAQENKGKAKLPVVKWITPQRYSIRDKTELRATITEANDALTFSLTTKPGSK